MEEAILPAPADSVNFGRAVAVSGDVALIGVPLSGPDQAGAVHIYRYAPGAAAWRPEAVLEGLNPHLHFGWSVAADGDLAVIGTRIGQKAHVFRFDMVDGVWHGEARLRADDGVPIGRSIAISGNRVVAGAPDDDAHTGAAYVFRRGREGRWMQEAKLTAYGGQPQDYFGRSVDIAGERAIVGAPAGIEFDAFGAGSARVFCYNRGARAWIEEARLRPAGEAAESLFGWSVGISDSMAVVGAALDSEQGATAGAAYAYRLGPAGWFEQGKLLASDGAAGHYLGRSAAIAGQQAVAGAGVGFVTRFTGAAYVFDLRNADCNDNALSATEAPKRNQR